MTKYNTQFKLKVVKEYLKFGGLKRIAHLFEINTSDIGKWTLAYQTHGVSSLKNRAPHHYTPEFKLSVFQFMKFNQRPLFCFGWKNHVAVRALIHQSILGKHRSW